MGISEHDRRPKEVLEREKQRKLMEEKKDHDDYMKMLIGRIPEKKLWQPYIKSPDKVRQMGNGQLQPLFKRESYIEPGVLLARQMRDDVVFGKPIFRLFTKPLKPNDVNVDLGGIKKDVRSIY